MSSARSTRGDEWKKYDKGLNESVALEVLRDSVRKQDEEKVEKAIERCRGAGLQDNKKVKEAGEIHLPVICARNRLKKACKELDEKGGDERVRNELTSIKKNGLSPYLQQEVREAKSHLEWHELYKRREKPKAVSLAMDSKTVAEIRRYQNPPDVLRKVIQAALLLVGEDEDMTDSWKNCQRICNPYAAYGKDDLCQRLFNFDPSKAHPEIVARAKQILKEIKFDDVQSDGRSATLTFYVWAMGSIEKSEAAAKKEEEKKKQDAAGAKAPPADKTEKSGAPGDKTPKAAEKHERKKKSKIKPASRKRQKEIFGRLPSPQDDRDYTKLYNMTVTTKKEPKGKAEGEKSFKADGQ